MCVLDLTCFVKLEGNFYTKSIFAYTTHQLKTIYKMSWKIVVQVPVRYVLASVMLIFSNLTLANSKLEQMTFSNI